MSKPIYVLSGYLGAGKTTLTQNLLKDQPAAQTMLLVNELSPFSIDKNLVSLPVENIFDLSGGCACCNLGPRLAMGVSEAVRREEITQLFIETTGVALPGQLMQMALTVEGTRHGGVISVVDTNAFLQAPGDRDLMEKQVAQSDLILLNKIDLVDDDMLAQVEAAVQVGMREGTMLIKTRYSETTMAEVKSLLDGVEPGPSISQYCDTVTGKYDTLLLIKRGGVDRQAFDACLRHDGVVRAKGLIQGEGLNTLFQYAGKQLVYTDHAGSIRATQVVVIVKTADREEVEQMLNPLFNR